jgi:uncharacterized protein with von Willebrand factor type A (vWA) domain
MAMQERMGKFVSGLRASGVRVSVAESEDAWKAVQHMGVIDREAFRLSLRSTLIKDPTDIPIFEDLFPMYFGNDAPPLLNPMAELSPDQQADLWDAIREMAGDLEELLNWLLSGQTPSQEDLEDLADMAGMEMANSPYQAEWYARRMQRLLGWQQLPEILEQIWELLAEMGMSPQDIEAVKEQVAENQERLSENLEGLAGRQIMDQIAEENRGNRNNIHELMQRNFNSLSEREIQLLREQVRRLAARLRSRVALRQKRGKAGKLDAKATIRANLRYAGVPLELRYKTRRQKPKLVVLCDVSTSMRPVAEFMLHLLYELQDQVAKTRSFAFINQIVDVSDVFANTRPADAVQGVLQKLPPGYYNTDLGNTLHGFVDDFLNTVDNRTTFIVLGDGRNNYNDPALDALKKIKARSRRILWLNPEYPRQWGTGDSDMLSYEPLCDHVYQVRSLNQLASAIDKLMT